MKRIQNKIYIADKLLNICKDNLHGDEESDLQRQIPAEIPNLIAAFSPEGLLGKEDSGQSPSSPSVPPQQIVSPPDNPLDITPKDSFGISAVRSKGVGVNGAEDRSDQADIDVEIFSKKPILSGFGLQNSERGIPDKGKLLDSNIKSLVSDSNQLLRQKSSRNLSSPVVFDQIMPLPSVRSENEEDHLEEKLKLKDDDICLNEQSPKAQGLSKENEQKHLNQNSSNGLKQAIFETKKTAELTEINISGKIPTRYKNV